ncbi:MAG: hypothetical protein PUJ56_00105 [Butyricicoccus sp.]|nr:hypothetical protein [Butyricicoccus sp.]MDY4087301.1 hypothetical protein [Butyricicoccus intestinisimiae]
MNRNIVAHSTLSRWAKLPAGSTGSLQRTGNLIAAIAIARTGQVIFAESLALPSPLGLLVRTRSPY